MDPRRKMSKHLRMPQLYRKDLRDHQESTTTVNVRSPSWDKVLPCLLTDQKDTGSQVLPALLSLYLLQSPCLTPPVPLNSLSWSSLKFFLYNPHFWTVDLFTFRPLALLAATPAFYLSRLPLLPPFLHMARLNSPGNGILYIPHSALSLISPWELQSHLRFPEVACIHWLASSSQGAFAVLQRLWALLAYYSISYLLRDVKQLLL